MNKMKEIPPEMLGRILYLLYPEDRNALLQSSPFFSNVRQPYSATFCASCTQKRHRRSIACEKVEQQCKNMRLALANQVLKLCSDEQELNSLSSSYLRTARWTDVETCSFDFEENKIATLDALQKEFDFQGPHVSRIIDRKKTAILFQVQYCLGNHNPLFTVNIDSTDEAVKHLNAALKNPNDSNVLTPNGNEVIAKMMQHQEAIMQRIRQIGWSLDGNSFTVHVETTILWNVYHRSQHTDDGYVLIFIISIRDVDLSD